MRYRQCNCGSRVEECFDDCPICEADLSELPMRECDEPTSDGPTSGGAGGFSASLRSDDGDGQPRVRRDSASSAPLAAAHDEWYYMADGRMEGPCELDFLVGSLDCGALSLETQVWKPGMKTWTAAGSVAAISARLQPRDSAGTADEASGAGLDSPADRNFDGPGFDTGLQYGEMPDQRAGPFGGSGDETGAYPDAPRDHLARVSPLATEEERPGMTARRDPLAAPAWTAVQDVDGDAAAPSELHRRELLESSPPSVPSATHPWRRWFARIVDVSLASFALGLGMGFLAPELTVLESDVIGPLVVLAAWMLAEPFVLSGLGTTPGKALLNIRLRQADNVRLLRLNQALSRSFRVWFHGMAGGLPIISLFTMANAYVKLGREGATQWDQHGGFMVTHGDLGPGRILGIAGYVCLILLFVVLGSLA